MSTDPAHETTPSAEVAAFIAESAAKGPLRIYSWNKAIRIIRNLDAKLVAERERSRQWENRADTAEMANAALTERLRVAEERLREWDDYKRALAYRGPETVITMQASDPAPCGILAPTSDAAPKEATDAG